MLSPVWTPIGSKFSMEHTVMQLSFPSLMISNSISFQWCRYFSISTWPIIECRNPFLTTLLSSSSFHAIPEPRPPSTYAGLTITGYPIFWAAFLAASRLEHESLGATDAPAAWMALLNSSLSSVFMIASTEVPSTLTPYLSRTPSFASFTPVFKAVCPPKPRIMPSGLSFFIIFSMNSGVTGSRYTLSAISYEVCIVATLGFTKRVSTPSSRMAFSAWDPL